MISIHALREEGDPLRLTQKLHIGRFLSTPSARRATGRLCLTVPIPMISIHALREEGDLPSSKCTKFCVLFLSTPSARRATVHRRRRGHGRRISIHALREEGDRSPIRSGCCSRYFYPRPPRGGRRRHVGDGRALGAFLSTPSARRATRTAACPAV